MYLFYRVLKVRWVLRQYLLEHQCGSGRFWSHNCHLLQQGLVLGWHATCMCTAGLEILCHPLYGNLWCYQGRWLLGSNMQWNCKLNVFALKWGNSCLLIYSTDIYSTSSMCPIGDAVMSYLNIEEWGARVFGSFTENFIIIFHTRLSLQGAVIDMSAA